MQALKRIAGLWSDRRGSVAIIFALSLFVVIGGVGLSIDGARIYSADQRLQSAVDAAALAAARRAALAGSSAEISATFSGFLAASESLRGITVRSATSDTSQPRRIAATVIGDVPTVIMPVFGFASVEIQANAVVEFGFTRLEVALVLDNTGSMAGMKLDALKASANRLVDSLLDRSSQPGTIQFALVPFSDYVNVGLDKRGASWLSVPNDSATTVENCRDVRPEVSRSNCRQVTYTYSNDGIPATGSYEACDVVYGSPVYTCTPSTSTSTWHGCVGSRNYPLNIRDGDYGTPVPGVMDTWCGAPILPLTDDRSALHAAINGMSASGSTYLPPGIVWGWRVLSPDEPFAESAGVRNTPSGDRINKILILMTDGSNTKSPSYPSHNGSDVASANTLTMEACTAVKGADIKIFTIAFDVTDATVKNILRSCASTVGGYFDAGDAAQLDAAMQAIGQQLGALRLTN